MIEKLQQAGFNRIVIADDVEENILAAQELEKRLPGIAFEFHRRGDVLVAQIPERYKEIDLIITDRQMETPDVGLDVIEAAWSYHLPAFVCSGGYQHRGKPLIRVGPPIKSNLLGKEYIFPEGMTKKDPDMWSMLLEAIIEDTTGKTDSQLKSVLMAKKCGVDIPQKTVGYFARRTAEGCLSGHY